MSDKFITTKEEKERAILVGVELPNMEWPLNSSLAELERLVDTAGAEVVSSVTQRLASPNPSTFVGNGKAEEIAFTTHANNASLVVFDDELTPSQQANLERIMGKNVKVIDRTALILDIFALHAKSKEGRLQVRLAQNQYLYPRLRGMWAHLASNRMGGGVGSRFGEGESQLEVDRRIIRKRITSIKRELKHLAEVRNVQRESRIKSGIYKVALAGYTNAGKSSLLNRLTNAGVYSDDKLFATLDSTTRKLMLPEGREVTLSDTVGFIQKLPTTLVEAFRSTLDEISEADLVLHVIDANSHEREAQAQAVRETLQQIGAESIPRIDVYNKADLLPEDEKDAFAERYPNAELVSASTGSGIESLLNRIGKAAASMDVLMDVCIPYERGELVSIAHDSCRIINEGYTENGTVLTVQVPKNLEKLFSAYVS